MDLAGAVGRAVEAARPLVDAAGHTLTVALPPDPTEIVVDPTRFEQVLVNLLNNAAKYTEQKGRIDLVVEIAGGEVALRVRDNGLGMPADLVPKVFDLFVQGERSLARSQGGLGIGLTMVRNLVELHGGRVSARSEGIGRGSEFEVRLPLVTTIRRAAEAAGNPQDDGADGASLRVLVVEDTPDVTRTLTDLLAHWGHDVRHAETGEEGLRVADEFEPHVVLVDIGLPGMSGYDVARQLPRALGRAREPEAPLIVGLSGYGQERDRKQGIEAGFDHHLVKPPDPDALRRLVMRRAAATADAAS